MEGALPDCRFTNALQVSCGFDGGFWDIREQVLINIHFTNINKT
jgi:hypothetical protein